MMATGHVLSRHAEISTLHAALLVIVVKLSAPVMVYRQERKRWALKLVKMQPKKAKDYLQQRIGNALNAEMLTGLGGRLVTYAMLPKLET